MIDHVQKHMNTLALCRIQTHNPSIWLV